MVNEKRLIDATEARKHSTHDIITHFLDRCPTVDAVEVVHGRWIEHPHINFEGGYNGADYECSICGFNDVYDIDGYNYCPNCGAKMDGGNEDGRHC